MRFFSDSQRSTVHKLTPRFSLCRKEAHREFRRLYHLEEKRRQQLLNRHECEIEEQRQEFRRKREELSKKYEFELQTIDQKQKIEIERENLLLTNEYNRRIKQIRLGSFSARTIA